MQRMAKSARAVVIVMAIAFAHPLHAQTTTCTSYSDPSNPQTATCNGTSWGSSKLFAKDKAVVYAPEIDATNPGGPGIYKQCRTVNGTNDLNTNIFVPWNTPTEWDKFLASPAITALGVTTSGCCVPMPVPTQVTCPDGTVVNLPASAQGALAHRVIGTFFNGVNGTSHPIPANISTPNTVYQQFPITTWFPNDYGVNEWGADGDTYGPINITQDASGNPINYTFTFLCEGSLALTGSAAYTDPTQTTMGYGGWVQTQTSGVCKPQDGKCNGTLNGANLTNLPGDLSTLCTAGSSLSNLVTLSGGWTWTCNGTGGTGCASDPGGICTNQNCSATLSGYSPGALCGQDNKGSFTTLTSTSAGLCAAGNTIDAFVAVSNPAPYAFAYTWTCIGSDGTYRGCGAYNNTPVNGECGSLRGGSPLNASQIAAYVAEYTGIAAPPANPLCASGLLGTVQPINDLWYWGCEGLYGGTSVTTCAAANTAFNGVCGTAENQSFPSTPPQAQLCSSGQPSPLPINFDGTTWTWSCSAGTGGGTPANCQATFDSGAVIAQCGVDGGTTAWPAPPPASSLCAAGNTPIARAVSGFVNTCKAGDMSIPCLEVNDTAWEWACEGSTTDGQPAQLIQCYVPADPGTTANLCGTSNGTPSAATAPTNLCISNSNPIAPPQYSAASGEWTWQCQNASGTLSSCNTTAAAGSGACSSLTNGQYLPAAPNVNLCTGGGTPPVSGSGSAQNPWTWTCTNGVSSQQCNAYLCQVCQNTITQSGSATVIGTIGGAAACTISATASWTGVYQLLTNGETSKTLSWLDGLDRAFEQTVTPNSTGNPYCSPCYTQLQGVQGTPSMTVTKVKGTCPYSPGDSLPVSGVSVE